jgi:hypothetical protein
MDRSLSLPLDVLARIEDDPEALTAYIKIARRASRCQMVYRD